jgi:hypothetical protein
VHIPADDRPKAAEAIAEAVGNLDKLTRYAAELVAGGSDHLDVSVVLTRDLIDTPDWDPLSLASALAVAVADLTNPGGPMNSHGGDESNGG